MNSDKFPAEWKRQSDGMLYASWSTVCFLVEVTTVIDEYPDLSYLGELVGSPGEGSIDTHCKGFFFQPAIDYLSDIQSDISKEEAKQQADKYSRENLARFMSHGDSWNQLTLCVEVSSEGIVLSRQYMGRIESDSGEEYFSDVASDLAGEAIEEAQEKIRKLMEKHREYLDISLSR